MWTYSASLHAGCFLLSARPECCVWESFGLMYCLLKVQCQAAADILTIGKVWMDSYLMYLFHGFRWLTLRVLLCIIFHWTFHLTRCVLWFSAASVQWVCSLINLLRLCRVSPVCGGVLQRLVQHPKSSISQHQHAVKSVCWVCETQRVVSIWHIHLVPSHYMCAQIFFFSVFNVKSWNLLNFETVYCLILYTDTILH